MQKDRVILEGLARDLSEVIDQLTYTKEDMIHGNRDTNEFNSKVIDGQIEQLFNIRSGIRVLQENAKDFI